MNILKPYKLAIAIKNKGKENEVGVGTDGIILLYSMMKKLKSMDILQVLYLK